MQILEEASAADEAAVYAREHAGWADVYDLSRTDARALSERAARAAVPRRRADTRRRRSAGAASASPPASSAHRVANAIAAHSRDARVGSDIRVRSQRQPPLLIALNEHPIRPRVAYHDASASPGGRSVRISHGAACPSSHRARSVQASRAYARLKARPRDP